KLCYQQAPGVEDAHRKQEVDAGEEEPAAVERSAARTAASKFRGAEDEDGSGTTVAVAERRAAPVQQNKKALPADPRQQQALVDEACAEPMQQLASELNLCRRYYESTFPNKPVDRLIFVGGEARHRTLCQHVARDLSLAAQVGDPLVRMGRTTSVGIESGLDRRQAQPGWAVAIGLSLGPTETSQVVSGQ